MEGAITDGAVSDSQLAASLFVIQFVMVAAVMLGALLSRYWTHRSVMFPFKVGGTERTEAGMLDIWLLTFWLVLTLAPLTFTALNLSGWTTIGFQPPELPVRSAARFAFVCNLLFSTWFVMRSGGWADSPFTSVMIAVPTFAILLGESLTWVFAYIAYVVVVSGLFHFLNAATGYAGTKNSRDRILLNSANWLLSSIMLGLTAWIGMFGSK